MSTESKDFDHYAIVLSDLRAKRDQIDQAILAIESVRGGGVQGGGSQPAANQTEQPTQAGDFLGMSISDATKKLLKAKRKQMNNAEVLAALRAGGMVMASKDPINIVGAVLTRRFKEVGDIVKVDRGTWGLKEWYPGKSFGKPTKGNGGNEASSSASAPPLTPDPDDPLG